MKLKSLRIESLGMKLHGKYIIQCNGLPYAVEAKSAAGAVAKLRAEMKKRGVK